MTNCDKCNHTGVCIFEKPSREFEMSIPTTIPDNITIIFKCKNFQFKYKSKQSKKDIQSETN